MASEQAIPRTLLNNRFTVTRRLGAGSSATVYSAFDHGLGRWRAIKVLRAGPADLRSRLESEARVMARLEHPNILRVYDILREDTYMCIVMDLAVAGSLDDWTAVHGPLPAHTAVAAMRDVCRALVHAHAAGVIHSDVKPQNILTLESGRWCLSDFGLAATSGRLGQPRGTLGFIAPEHRSDGVHDVRGDIYSAGATLLCLVTGRRPPELWTDSALPPDAKVPASLQRVIQRAMALAPDDRYQSAAEMLAALNAIQDTMPGVLPGESIPVGISTSRLPVPEPGDWVALTGSIDHAAPFALRSQEWTGGDDQARSRVPIAIALLLVLAVPLSLAITGSWLAIGPSDPVPPSASPTAWPSPKPAPVPVASPVSVPVPTAVESTAPKVPAPSPSTARPDHPPRDAVVAPAPAATPRPGAPVDAGTEDTEPPEPPEPGPAPAPPDPLPPPRPVEAPADVAPVEAPAPTVETSLAIFVNVDVPVDARMARRALTGHLPRWSDGTPVVVVLPPAGSTAARWLADEIGVAERTMLRMLDESVFRGGAVPLKSSTMRGAALSLEEPGAIGVAFESDAPEGLQRVLP